MPSSNKIARAAGGYIPAPGQERSRLQRYRPPNFAASLRLRADTTPLGRRISAAPTLHVRRIATQALTSAATCSARLGSIYPQS